MNIDRRTKSYNIILFAITMLWLGSESTPAMAEAQELHIAIGDIPAIEFANLLNAVEKTRARGVVVSVSYLGSEDISMEAIKNDLADIGVGTPYLEVQESDPPIRMFFQLSRLRFFPVVNTHFYHSWEDLAGADIYAHSRGSGTEAVMNFMAAKHGIEFGAMHYLAGSSVRADAMLRGQIKATIVDSPRRRRLLNAGGGRFATLPTARLNATDEALYAKQSVLEQKSQSIAIFVEEMLKAWREINAAPSSIAAVVEQTSLIGAIPSEDMDEIVPYYEESVANNSFPNNGGNADDVRGDLEFFTSSRTIVGDPASLKIEDFWYFAPLQQALDKLGRK